MIVVLRGKPGVGKTTLVSKIIKGIRAVGFYTKEIRNSQGRRIGFDIVLHNGKIFKLARKVEGEPKIGKYRVFVEELEKALD
ncbi:MAG TPA: nucleoside triphosphatase, partial [Thermotoga sp.]|nr:nucleoside triphosphatase [Thermotoga sp.]